MKSGEVEGISDERYGWNEIARNRVNFELRIRMFSLEWSSFNSVGSRVFT